MADLPEEGLALIRQFIVSSPYGKLLGAELVEATPNRAVVRLPFRDDVTTIGDTVHGGAISGLVDITATAAFWANETLDPTSRGTTIGFSINFLAAGRASDLMATAELRRRGREISTAEVTVRDGAEKEVAVALVTYKLSTA